MGIKDKIRKLANFIDEVVEDHLPVEPVAPPLPPRPPGMNKNNLRRDASAPTMMEYGALPKSFFNAVNSAREQAGYDVLPVFGQAANSNGEEHHTYEEADVERVAFHRNRSKSRDRAAHPRSRSRGTPVKFRRQPASPEFFQQQQQPPPPSSPFLFRQHSLPNMLPNHPQFLRQQPQQFDMRMAYYPVEFYPQQFQQPFYPMMINPHMNMQPWFIRQQPQMYPFY